MSVARHHLAAVVAALLVVLAGCTVGGVGFGDDGQWFEEVSDERGLEYETSGDPRGNGDGGVYASDVDRDGWPDLLVTGDDQPVLFENTGGQFERSNLLPELNVTEVKAVLFFDYDNDGWEDLLLAPLHDEMILLENTGGQFERRDLGLATHVNYADGASAADYNGDGCLDVFVIQNGNWEETVPARTGNPDSFRENDTGNPNLLFEGHCGEAPFENVTAEANITGTRWSLATSFVDFTGDGLPDVHVANDFNYDVVYVNQGDGTFRGHDVPDTNRHGMASDAVDVNGDGRLDVFVTNIEWEDPGGVWALRSSLDVRNRGNNLLINRGNGTFEDRATAYGMRVTDGWGWSGHLVDFDDDGDRDLLHTTKYYLRTRGNELYQPVKTRPTVWERTGPENFSSRNASRLGLEPSDGRGMAVLDYDRDGDQDFVIADTTDDFKLYENRVADRDGGHWLSVRVRGTPEQTPVGAEVYVTTGNGTRFAVMNSGTNFFSQDARPVHFGLGDAEVHRVRVVWPDGTEHALTDVPTDASLVVNYDGSVETRER